MQALILAGGKGERLRPYTEDRPKAMVPILGRPLVEYQVRWLKENGVERIVFLCGYLHEVLAAHFGNGSEFGLRIDYSIEETPLGRGGGLKQGFTHVGRDEGPVLATNGDVLTAEPLAPFLAAHQQAGALASVLLAPLISPYGIADLDDGRRIRGFQEKPVLPYWINAGVYLLDRQCENLLPDLGDHEDSTFPELAERGLLYGYQATGYWRAVDTVKDMTEAQRELPGQFPHALLNFE
jgi:NDP-sugar pyrophosphorylase family protein